MDHPSTAETTRRGGGARPRRKCSISASLKPILVASSKVLSATMPLLAVSGSPKRASHFVVDGSWHRVGCSTARARSLPITYRAAPEPMRYWDALLLGGMRLASHTRQIGAVEKQPHSNLLFKLLNSCFNAHAVLPSFALGPSLVPQAGQLRVVAKAGLGSLSPP